ncbi:dihydroxyacid dehydratase/phosphogluconate dehydratase [Actinoalloteichus sp. GBA129-24]|uniref:Dihydroxyacid dehydratase/phosphogluconate dehydratase n=2 Tax=Pseudonocardiaceae TaxID=2070 RepID=A0AAC9L9H9_9PSEU|nr:dihydroxyacid dehydratase/phosphogluconate dehydratase [Actinoalloteichus fjordicus]APU18791.1 dihydroxyacid dehydratase/phosphogluconate dehydratase [Actinoalloteichus sp. GBA129-24]
MTGSGPGPAGLRGKLTNYGDADFALFLRKAFIKGAGYTDDALDRTVVGIVDTGSGFNPCHGNMPQLIEAVKRGVLLAGGLPVEFPTISLHESFSQPTSMYLRNLMSMDTEEMLRALPVDSVVLIGGCDKTVPAQLMGAASAGLPAITLVTGSMLTGSHRGTRVGACTDCRGFWGKYRGGEIDDAEIAEVNPSLVGSVGTCSVAGTASTMACIAEAAGVALPGSATPPAVTADRMRIAELTGRRATEIAEENLTIDKILTEEAFENALRVLLAVGGSTNGIVHLAAVAGRLGFTLDLDRFDAMSRQTPVLVNLKPAGTHYMEDLHKAGGVPRLLAELRDLLNLDAPTITGRTIGEELAAAPAPFPQEVIRPRTDPIYPSGSIAVLRGNLAPAGAVIKQAAADQNLLEHRGRAVVFENSKDMALRIDGEDLDVEPDDVLVLKNIGPVGAPGMPEAGYIPIPRKLARRGVKDMVRISDGRMSGTAGGTIVLHVSPEAAIGGPLKHVRDGDTIRLSVADRIVELEVSDEELRRRAAAPTEIPTPPSGSGRGYRRLYLEQVTQAEEGCDFRFLQAETRRGSVPREH